MTKKRQPPIKKRDSSFHWAVTELHITGRILEAARLYRQYAPIPRIAFYDVTYPVDAEEYHEMNGYGLLLITSLTQNTQEHPLERVYFESSSGERQLEEIINISSEVEAKWSEITKTFGPYRIDCLYLFPMLLRKASGEVKIDYSQNRKGLILMKLPHDLSHLENNLTLPADEPTAGSPSRDALLRLLDREVPAFAKAIRYGT